MIKPSIGRVVWFYERGKAQLDAGEQPNAAMIAHVWSDSCINVGYLDSNGVHLNATSVTLVQEGETPPDHYFAMWMPFQIGQAKAQAAS